MTELERKIKEKAACITTLQERGYIIDNLVEYITPKQIDKIIKALEEVWKMHTTEGDE